MFTNLMKTVSVLALGGAVWMAVPAVPAQAQSVAGAYLAGRHAAVNSDYRAAARYYTEALAQDPQNAELMESGALSYLSLGEIDKALPMARALAERNKGSQVARLVLTARLAEDEDYKALLAQQEEPTGIGPWVDGLIKAWAHLGAGDVTSSLAAFDSLSEEPGMQGFVMYHKALALASVGDYESAAALFEDGKVGSAGQTRRGVIAHVQILAQLDQREAALKVLEKSFGKSSDPELDLLKQGLADGSAVPFTVAPDPQAGLAEVFFTFAAVLRSEEAGEYYVLLYSRIARYLRPDHIDALLLTANLLEALGQYPLAIEEYADVPAEDATYHAAELGRANALRRSGRSEQAIEVLNQLARTHGDLAVVHSTLGDMLSGQDDWAGAIDAYDRAISLTEEGNRALWALYYARGIAQERSDNMDAAEADFRRALKLNPEQPRVLNYLGYSLVEEQRNLDEALDMIERAVEASPQSGYIIDSLGWVLYRLGRYDEAVSHMERAVELEAVDPVVNDHLGDVYWAVGRKREAEFQWRRALSFIDPEDRDSEADPERIRRKLELGLDAVLAEEGSKPLKVSDDR